MPGGSITAIAQTSDGYLWIGTDRGLLRFDGLSFRQFEQAHPDPMPIGAVRTLVVDASDNLWILLQTTQVFRYHNGIFEPIRGWTVGGTTAMARGTSGAVLLSSSAAGTLTYSENRFKSLSSAALLADAARDADNETFDHRTTPFSWFDRLASPTSLVVSMAQTDDGKIWLATVRRGLFYLQKERISGVSNPSADTKINCFLPLENSEMWIGTANGVLRWNGKEITSAAVPSPFLHLDVVSILRDRDSNIWIGTSRGLFRYNANGVSPLSAHETIGPVTALFEDREGSIWFGSTHGLERLRDSTFVTYALPNSKSQSAGALHVDSGGRIWVAPIQAGLRWLKGGKSGTVTADGIANDVVYSIAGIDEHDIWVGRQQGGLTQLVYSGNSPTAKTYTQADGLVQNSVYAVYESVDRAVWAGTLSGGVSKLKDGHFTNYTTSDGLASNTVSAIAEGTDGTMWFGTPIGLSEFSGKRWRNYAVPDGLVSPDVNSLFEDSDHILWIGTAGGLAFLRNGRIEMPRGAQDWLHEPVLGMAEDRNGWLWVATSTRVLRAKRSSLTDNSALDDSDFRVYTHDDGWDGTEGIKRFRSVAKDALGNVWFSTNHGLAVVNPAQSAVNSVPALLRVEAVMVDGNEVSLEPPIRVPPGEHRIAMHYLGLNLANPERVRYRSRLDGIDHQWSEVTSNRDATFANLGPGKYQFRVISSSSDGTWDNKEASIDFSVLPAFYQTNWFRLLCAAALLALLWGISQLRVQQLQRQFSIALEARFNERMRIARELHDTLLQDFQASLIQMQATRNLISRHPEKTLESLDDAIDAAAGAIAEGRDAIQGLRSEPLSQGNLAELLTAASLDLAKSDNANGQPPIFDLIEVGKRKALSPTIYNEVCPIALEILRNAYRHAQAQRIEAEIQYGQPMFRLRIRDDGKGIDAMVLKEGGKVGHWGLRGMHERASRIGAQLDFWTKADAGTEVQLAVPASVAYQVAGDGVGLKLLLKFRHATPRS